ncbi:MAG: ChbG/HpnK family deacetylase [Tepidisphaerales bacterium]
MVTADDFGIGEATSWGIVDAVRAGAVDRISVMVVTGEHLLRSLSALDAIPRPPVGLHLTLCSNAGRPLTATRAGGFVRRDGGFVNLRTLWLRGWLGRLDRHALEDEILAQVDRFRSLLGHPPAHLDGHQHAHELPGVAETVTELLRQRRLPPRLRCTAPPDSPHRWHGSASLHARRALIHHLGRRARPLFRAADAQLTDGFLGIIAPPPHPPPPAPPYPSPDLTATTRPAPATASPWAAELASVQSLPGVYEMMVHPGRADPTLQGRDPYVQPRVNELQWLLALGPAVSGRAPPPQASP